MSVIDIRKAEPSDIDWLIGELYDFELTYGLKKVSFLMDEKFAREKLLELIEKHVAFIATKDFDRAGFIIGYYGIHPFTKDLKALQELFFWVSHEYRKTRAAAMLMNAFVESGKKIADWIIFARLPGSNISERTLTRKGFRLMEQNYCMEV